MEDKHP